MRPAAQERPRRREDPLVPHPGAAAIAPAARFAESGKPAAPRLSNPTKALPLRGNACRSAENRLHPCLPGPTANHHTLAMIGDHRADAGTAAHKHAAGVRRAGCIQEGVAGQQQGAAKGRFPKRRTPQTAAKQEGRAKNQQCAEHPNLHKRIIGADGGKREPRTKRGRLLQPLGEQRRACQQRPARNGTGKRVVNSSPKINRYSSHVEGCSTSKLASGDTSDWLSKTNRETGSVKTVAAADVTTPRKAPGRGHAARGCADGVSDKTPSTSACTKAGRASPRR